MEEGLSAYIIFTYYILHSTLCGMDIVISAVWSVEA